MFSRLFAKNKDETRIKTAAARVRKNAIHKQDRIKKSEKISVDQLRIGMYVRQLDIPWDESSFMLQGFDVESQQDVLDVQKQCKHVWVDYIEYLREE